MRRQQLIAVDARDCFEPMALDLVYRGGKTIILDPRVRPSQPQNAS